MTINKIFLETDGLVVGNNQLVASGGNISVGNNLSVYGNTFINGLSANGSTGNTGQVLVSGGSNANAYWANSNISVGRALMYGILFGGQ